VLGAGGRRFQISSCVRESFGNGPNPRLVRTLVDKRNNYFLCWELLLLQFFSCSLSSLDELNDLPQ